MKPFAGTLRVTDPVRHSRASSRQRVLRGDGRPSLRSVWPFTAVPQATGGDGVIVRLIGTWLDAGVLEDGVHTTPEPGRHKTVFSAHDFRICSCTP